MYHQISFIKQALFDIEEAVLWYEKAAKQGLKDAQKNLSTMYELGYGVEKDLKMAKFWLNEYLNNDKEGI